MKHLVLSVLLALLAVPTFAGGDSEQLQVAALKKDKAVSTRSFDQKSFAAHRALIKRFEAEGWPATSDEALKMFESAEKKRKPVFEGYDHDFHALADILAQYARIKARYATKLHDKAFWYYVAGEAQYGHTKTGTEDFQAFLSEHTLAANDPRVEMARERLKQIQKLDEGLFK